MKKNLLRKTLVLSLILVSVATVANAQVKFGIKAGANLSNIAGFEKMYNFIASETGAGEIKTDMKVGYLVGISTSVYIKQLFLQADLEYNMQGMGAKAKEDVDDEEIESENFHLHYLKLPVKIGYKFNLNPDNAIIFGVGVYGGYLVAMDDYLKDELNFKKVDYGLTGMIGMEFVNHRITIAYDHGLVDLVDLDGWSDYKKANKLSALRNSTIKLAYTYYF